MWHLLPKIRNELVSIVLTPRYLACSWIKTMSGHKPFELKAYRYYNLPPTAFHHSVVFNPTRIKNYIQNFLMHHNLRDAFIALSVTGTGIVDKVTPLTIASPTKKDFKLPELENCLWDFYYLYHTQEAASAFYVSGIKHELLFQYKLLAIATNTHLVSITTQGNALLNLYSYVHGKAFRHAQLAVDMTKHNNELLSLFTPEILRRLLHINPTLPVTMEKDMAPLIKSLGVFVVGGKQL